MRCKKSTSKYNFYITLLELLNEGKTPFQISKQLNVSRQKIYYYTTVLKELGFVEKKGYGVWEVKRCKKEDLEYTLNWRDKKIRGHAFIWKIKSKEFDWKKLLEKKKIRYNLVRGYTPRIIINGRKVWLGKKSITIFESKSFYGKHAIESRKYAVFELKSILDSLQSKLGINLGKYLFKPVREHYGIIKNELARQCNNRGEKIIVRDDLDGGWLWIDDSEGMEGELETGGRGVTKDRAALNMNVSNWWNDNKKHNFKVTPTFVLQNMNNLIEDRKFWAEHQKSHIKAIQTLSKSVSSLTKEVLKLKNERKRLIL